MKNYTNPWPLNLTRTTKTNLEAYSEFETIKISSYENEPTLKCKLSKLLSSSHPPPYIQNSFMDSNTPTLANNSKTHRSHCFKRRRVSQFSKSSKARVLPVSLGNPLSLWELSRSISQRPLISDDTILWITSNWHHPREPFLAVEGLRRTFTIF